MWNQADFNFCKKCGKRLPSIDEVSFEPPSYAPPAGPSAPMFTPAPAFPQAPASNEPTEEEPIHERPLASEETSALRTYLNKPPLGPLRIFAAFVGLIPLTMIGLAATGSGFPVLNYFAVVFASGLLGVILSSASKGMRTPVVKGISGGVAREVWGVPVVRPLPGGRAMEVELGGATFRVRSSLATGVLQGRMNRITYAPGGPGVGPMKKPGYSTAVVVDWNGQAPGRVSLFHVKDAPGASNALQGGGLMRTSRRK